MQQSPDGVAVAQQERLVEVKAGAQRCPIGWRRFHAEDAGDGVADGIAQHEGEQADDDEHENGVQRPVEKVPDHGPTPVLNAASGRRVT